MFSFQMVIECFGLHSKVCSYVMAWPAVDIRGCLFADCLFFCDDISVRIFVRNIFPYGYYASQSHFGLSSFWILQVYNSREN